MGLLKGYPYCSSLTSVLASDLIGLSLKIFEYYENIGVHGCWGV